MKTRNAAPSLLRDREIWTVLGAIVLANCAFVYAIAERWLPESVYYNGRFFLLGLVLCGGVFLFRGWKAPFDLVRPLLVWRINPLWLLLALLWPPAISVLTLVAKGVMLGTGLDELSRTTLALALRRDIFPNVLLGAFIGEIVWVGYAITRLRRHTTVLVASVIVGAFWAAWWTPIVLLGVGVIPGIPVPALFVAQIGVAIMCGFVYAHTRSGIVVLVLQLSVNCSLLIFPTAPFSGGVPTFIAFGVIYLLASLLLHLRFGPWPLIASRPGR